MTASRLLAAALLLSTAAVGSAAADSSWGGNVGLGYNWPLATAADNVDGGLAFVGGVSYAPESWPVALRFEFQWNDFDPKDSVLDRFEVGNGDARIWSLTANAEWVNEVSSRWGYYLIGGIGYYDRELELSEPGSTWITVCNPWWGICYPTLVPVNRVVGRYSDGSWGLNGGVGLTFPVSRSSEFYVEARYHWVDSDESSTQYIPLILGFRF